MDTVIIIPARYKSSRFPGKPLVKILEKTLIQRVWEQCIQVPHVDVYVATDDVRIEQHCNEKGMRCIMTSKSCLTGTDRVVEAYKKLRRRYQVIVNVQGDEPLITPEDIIKVYKTNQLGLDITCGQSKIDNINDFVNPNVVKVVSDASNYMLYASRAPIPTGKNSIFVGAYRQVCIYSFSDFVLEYFSNDRTFLETIEDIELLRFIENGLKIKMVNVSNNSVAVDVPEDVDRVENILLGR